MSRYVVLGAVAATVVCTVAAPSSATPPGKNGLIAFTRYSDASRNSGSIYVVDSNGKNERRVTRAPTEARDTQPDWSPDGARIVFERQYEDKPYEIFSVKPDGSGLKQIDPGCPTGEEENFCEENGPAWSPDGRRIAFVNGFGGLKFISGEEWIEVSAISLMNPDGSAVRQLTQLERPTSSEDHEPVWSPSGKQIAFVRLNSTAKPRNRQAIFVMNADGSGVRRVTPWSLNAGDHPDWSPDGRRILFRSTTSDLYGPLYTVRPDGTGLKQLTSFKPGIGVLSASFSPDGRSIVFSRSGKGRLPDLFVMRSDGKKIRQLTRTSLWDSAPDWGPAG